MTKNVKYFVKYKKEDEQNSHAGPLLFPSHQIPLKLRLSPHQHRHKSQRTICLSSSSTLRLMLRPVETNLPKANISSSETWRGGFWKPSAHTQQPCPYVPHPSVCLKYGNWGVGWILSCDLRSSAEDRSSVRAFSREFVWLGEKRAQAK